jgi:hypothetical protein
MANTVISSTTPIIKISQLPEETYLTLPGNPANTWFAIVNADVMKTKRISLEDLIKFIAAFLKPSSVNYFSLNLSGGLKANSAQTATVYLGNTVFLSDQITYDKANLAYDTANSAFGRANSSFIRANSAYLLANSAYVLANNAYLTANNAWDKANSPINISTFGGVKVNELTTTSIYLGNTITVSDNITYSIANTANIKAHTPFTLNTLDGLTGGNTIRLGETLNISGNNIYIRSNSAFARANISMINPPISYISSNVVLYSTNRYIVLADNLALTLQNNPTVNSYIYITNMGPYKNNILKSNGVSRIHGLSSGEDLRLNVTNVSVTFCFVDSVRGWVIV